MRDCVWAQRSAIPRDQLANLTTFRLVCSIIQKFRVPMEHRAAGNTAATNVGAASPVAGGVILRSLFNPASTQTRWICPLNRIILNINIRIDPCDKPNGIFRDKSSHLRIVEPRSIVKHSCVGIAFASGVAISRSRTSSAVAERIVGSRLNQISAPIPSNLPLSPQYARFNLVYPNNVLAYSARYYEIYGKDLPTYWWFWPLIVQRFIPSSSSRPPSLLARPFSGAGTVVDAGRERCATRDGFREEWEKDLREPYR